MQDKHGSVDVGPADKAQWAGLTVDTTLAAAHERGCAKVTHLMLSGRERAPSLISVPPADPG